MSKTRDVLPIGSTTFLRLQQSSDDQSRHEIFFFLFFKPAGDPSSATLVPDLANQVWPFKSALLKTSRPGKRSWLTREASATECHGNGVLYFHVFFFSIDIHCPSHYLSLSLSLSLSFSLPRYKEFLYNTFSRSGISGVLLLSLLLLCWYLDQKLRWEFQSYWSWKQQNFANEAYFCRFCKQHKLMKVSQHICVFHWHMCAVDWFTKLLQTRKWCYCTESTRSPTQSV